MAYAAWHGWPSGALLPVYTRAMNPCQVGIGPMHLPNRVFAAFRWANRQRGKQARYAPFPSIWGLRHPVVLADTQQVARHQVVQPRSPLSSDMGSVTGPIPVRHCWVNTFSCGTDSPSKFAASILPKSSRNVMVSRAK